MSEFNVIGKSIPRTDAVQQVTGKIVYGEDLYRPHMLYAKAHYSAYPHARILHIDIRRAEQMPGVKAVITHKDVPDNRFGFNVIDQKVLAEDKVHYRGDCIAVVAAETLKQAEAAAAAVKVTYEELPPLFDPFEAMKQDAPVIHEELSADNISHHLKIRSGDTEQGFKESYLIEKNVFKTQKVEHAPIEPHVALSELDPDGKLIVWTSSSRVFQYSGVMTKVMKIPMHMMQIKSPAVGGAFGGKNEVMLEPWVALLTQKTGRPVKMVFTREEEFRTSTIRHAYTITYKSSVSKDGKLLAAEIDAVSDCGAYLAQGKSQLMKAIVHLCGPYYVPNVKIDGYLVYTNTLVGSSMRGMGVPQACFACESQMDILALKLGMDPWEFRSINMFGSKGYLPNGQVINAEAMRKTYLRAVELYNGTARKEVRT